MKKKGIYCITSPSNKVYIGASTNIEKRFKHYKGCHCISQNKLYNSLKKYGWENHKKDILEECKVSQLLERETYWKQYHLDLVDGDWEKVLFYYLKDGNIEWRKNKTQRQLMSENIKKAKAISKYNPTLDKERNRKISESMKGKKRPLWVRKKMRGDRPCNYKPILQYTKDDIFIAEYESCKAAAEAMGKKSSGSIVEAAKDKYKRGNTAYGFKWKYKKVE